ncbi:MAG: DegT/DnrJ/EryC1/StrS family aminotransferase [Bacteroidales bacterium]
MKEIRMVDLHSQYLRIKPEIEAAMEEVIESTAFIKGPAVSQFEEELAAHLGITHVIACGNGTDALQAALMALELNPGDEIITTPFTFISTVEVIRVLGLKPVLVDVDPLTFNLNPELLEDAITESTRAILPVHLFGQCAHMEPILDLARKYGLYVIEDAAQALGSAYRFSDGTVAPAGSLGHMGTTSFFPSKNLGAFGDGGAIFTRDASFATRLRALVNHGMKERYYYDLVGVNSRLDTLQAAILRVKLKHLDSYHRARQEAAALYDEGLAGLDDIRLPLRSPFSTHIFHQYTLVVDGGRRDGLKEHLQKHGIPSMVYYPLPLHLQRAYRDLGYREGDLPVSESLGNTVLSLPMHTELTPDQAMFICTQIQNYFNPR